MPLPDVNGWLIDYRTADSIYSSGSNIRIDHCTQLCIDGKLWCCHDEKPLFAKSTTLAPVFINGHDCVVVPSDDALERSLAIASSPVGKKRLSGNEASVFLAGIAAASGYGVISDHRSIVFATVYDMCEMFGVPVYTADEYFDLLA